MHIGLRFGCTMRTASCWGYIRLYPFSLVFFCVLTAIDYCLELIKHYIPGEKRCLELFARNLLQGFTSWGNEVSTKILLSITITSERDISSL